MDNLYFIRRGVGKIPFKETEIKDLLSSDFDIVDMRLNDKQEVEGLVVKSVIKPELIDPVCNGIGLYLQDDGGYMIDPRFFRDSEAFFVEVIPHLMTDLELLYDDSVYSRRVVFAAKDHLKDIVDLIKGLSGNDSVSEETVVSDLERISEKNLGSLTAVEVFDYVLEYVDRAKRIAVAYDWSPTEFLEDVYRLIPHDLSIVDEDKDGSIRIFTLRTGDGAEIELEAETPEDVIDNVINPLLEKKTDLKIIYPRGSRYDREVHLFFIVKRAIADSIENNVLFVA